MKKMLNSKDLAIIGGFSDEIKRFEKKYPKGMKLTGANLRKLDEMDIRVSWILARCLHGAHWSRLCTTCGSIWEQFFRGEVTEDERDHQLWEERAQALRGHWKPTSPPKDVWKDYGYKGE